MFSIFPQHAGAQSYTCTIPIWNEVDKSVEIDIERIRNYENYIYDFAGVMNGSVRSGMYIQLCKNFIPSKHFAIITLHDWHFSQLRQGSEVNRDINSFPQFADVLFENLGYASDPNSLLVVHDVQLNQIELRAGVNRAAKLESGLDELFETHYSPEALKSFSGVTHMRGLLHIIAAQKLSATVSPENTDQTRRDQRNETEIQNITDEDTLSDQPDAPPILTEETEIEPSTAPQPTESKYIHYIAWAIIIIAVISFWALLVFIVRKLFGKSSSSEKQDRKQRILAFKKRRDEKNNP